VRDGELVLICDYYSGVLMERFEGELEKIGIFCEGCKKECMHNVKSDNYLLLSMSAKEYHKFQGGEK